MEVLEVRRAPFQEISAVIEKSDFGAQIRCEFNKRIS